MRARDDTPAARAFRQVLEQPEQAHRAGPGSERLVTLLAVAMALLLVVLAVLLGVQPMMDATERLALATEARRVQAAIQAYHTLDQLPAIPARGAPRRILPGDADAPFARFLQGPSRHTYRWFEEGLGLHTVAQEPTEAYGVLAVAALAHDLMQPTDSVQGLADNLGEWEQRLQMTLQRHVEAGNALGLVNELSGRVDILRFGSSPTLREEAPAVLISSASIHSHRYLGMQPSVDMAGSIVVYCPGGSDAAEIFWVAANGRPQYLLVAGGARTLPRRASRGR